jgi:hypothetical protein
LGRTREEVMSTAEAMKGKLILEPEFYVATINGDISPSKMAVFLLRTKPWEMVEDITREKGRELAEAINRH